MGHGIKPDRGISPFRAAPTNSVRGMLLGTDDETLRYDSCYSQDDIGGFPSQVEGGIYGVSLGVRADRLGFVTRSLGT